MLLWGANEYAHRMSRSDQFWHKVSPKKTSAAGDENG